MPKKDCSELAKVITELAMNIGTRPNVNTLADVTSEMQKSLPGITREEIVRSINEVTEGSREARSALQKKVDNLKREARRDKQLREAADALGKHVAAQTQPAKPKLRKRATPKEIAELQNRVDGLKEQLRDSDPARREAVKKRIAELDKHIAEGTVPAPRPKPEAPKDLAALRAERDRKLVEAKKPGIKAERIAELKKQIKDLDRMISEGVVPTRQTRPATPDDIKKLEDERNAKRKQAFKADPQLRADLRQQIDALNNHIQNKTYPVKEPTAPDDTPADVAALREERDRLRRKVEQYNPEKVDELKSQIAELQKHLKDGTLPPKSITATSEVPEEVQALRDARDAVLKELRKSEPALREKFEKQIKELTERIEKGVEAPVARKDELMSSDLERLAYERDKLRRDIRNQIDALKPKTWWGKTLEPVVEGVNLARSIMTSLDLSAVLRQGGFITLGNPARAAKSFVPMLQAFASPVKSHAIHQEIDARPNAPLYARSGLYLAPEEGGPDVTKQEEAFMSRLAGKIPLVAGSQRAYNTFLNKLRADSFDAMASTLARNGEPTLEEMRSIANYINVSTGRGKLGPMEPAAKTLNTVFFSPRYVTSRFQLLALQPFYGGNFRTRKLIAAEYGKMLLGLGIVMALGAASGGEIEKDPRSSDFGKIRFGNTRIDPLMGLSQTAVLVSQLAAGEKKTTTGNRRIVDLRGNVPYRGDTPWTIGTNFLRRKFAPFPGAITDVVTGRDAMGDKITPQMAVAKLFIPISFGDVYETMKAQGVPKGTAMSILNFFGMSIQTYDDR